MSLFFVSSNLIFFRNCILCLYLKFLIYKAFVNFISSFKTRPLFSLSLYVNNRVTLMWPTANMQNNNHMHLGQRLYQLTETQWNICCAIKSWLVWCQYKTVCDFQTFLVMYWDQLKDCRRPIISLIPVRTCILILLLEESSFPVVKLESNVLSVPCSVALQWKFMMKCLWPKTRYTYPGEGNFSEPFFRSHVLTNRKLQFIWKKY